MNKFTNWLKDILFPAHIKCIFCGEELELDTAYDTCAECFDSLPFIMNECERCGQRMINGDTAVCMNCKRSNFHFDLARAVFSYEDIIVKVVHEYKYSHASFLAVPLANYMLNKLSECNFDFDLITYVPIHENRLKTRGYNQAKLLAEHIEAAVGVECVNLCDKIVDSMSQTTLNYIERKKNIENTYKFVATRDYVKGKKVLIIDDVYTTGATSSELSRLIKEHGANKVFVLTLAHTVESKDDTLSENAQMNFQVDCDDK